MQKGDKFIIEKPNFVGEIGDVIILISHESSNWPCFKHENDDEDTFRISLNCIHPIEDIEFTEV